MKIKVGFIAPYRGLKEIAEKAVQKHPDIGMEIITADLYEAVKPAKSLEQQGFHVLVSRGGTARVLRENINLPVIEVDVSGYDILRTMLLIKDSKEPIELIGFPNVCRGVKEVAGLLDTHISYQTVNKEEEVEQTVRDAMKRGVQIIVGDTVTMKTAERYGLRGIMITSGHESIEQALWQAKEAARSVNQHQQVIEGYHSLLNILPEGVALLDESGYILYTNPAFQRLFQLEHRSAFLSEAAPELETFHHELAAHSFAQKNFIHQGRELSIEGALLFKGAVRNFFLKCSDETRYAIEQKGLSIHPLRSDIVSFSQISTADERVKDAVEKAKRSAHTSPILLITGENGTGKRSIAVALHHFETNHTENQWMVHLSSDFDETAFHRLKEHLGSSSGTYYIKHWEDLPEDWSASLLKTADHSPATCIFASVSSATADKVRAFFSEERILHLPPLRERVGHLEEYIRSFAARYNTLYGKQVVGAEKALLTKWREYKWPGNLEELQSFVQHGVYNAEGSFITEKDISIEKQTSGLNIDLTKPLADIEKTIIELVLAEEQMNQSQAAKRLGINRSTLWRKLKKD
ncbi:PrpR N-terminal domain-containing protein [Alteribacillus sp. HJP-4]|uniref:sigma-54-dependent Fis family transcriptional regulator n=1 Tax=Alteribacillus sp. HJP-4 TaxID=2775394 RepID=UPI0035CD152B